jgi:hypothetical protein
MALDFPANPVDGEVFGSYVWSASKGVWQSREESATVAITSPTAPPSANNGDLWYDTNRGVTYVYYNDGSSSQWVEVVTSGTPELSTKANLSGGNTFSGVQTLNTPLAIASGGTGGNSIAAAQTNLQIPLSFNYIINSAFDIWQRGTSTTNNTSYLADRWYVTTNATSISCNQSRVAANLSGKAGYALRVQQTASSTVVEYAARQFIEAQNIHTLAGKTVTVSFWYRSNKTGTHGARLTGSGRATGATDLNIGFTVPTADTWARYSITFSTFASATAWTVADNEWGAALDIGFRTGNSVGHTSLSANDYFEISGVQLEEGSVATTFRRNSSTIQGENAACQRYYHRISSTTQFTALAPGYQITTTEVAAFVTLPVRMRIRPTASASNVEWSDNALYSIGVSNFQINTASTPDQVRVNANISSNGSQFRPGTFRTASNSLGFIDFNAEL